MSRNINTYADLKDVVTHLRSLNDKKYILLFAFNGTGKTRLSMAFRQEGKQFDADGNVTSRDTLYFNAFTEDLFYWDNDLLNEEQRVLKLNKNSRFFDGLEELEMDNKIRPILHQYASFNFIINYESGDVKFEREEIINGTSQIIDYIKVSRGEENLFIWCFFLAIAQLAIDQQERYQWVKYIYIDDPISSLDENNAIAVACNLAGLIERDSHITMIVSTHHSLFFNVMYNEISRKTKNKCFFLHKKDSSGYALQDTGDSPFFHHIATLSQLKKAADANQVYTHHFNALRTILEKTASFFGYDKIDKCIHGLDDEVLFERALNLFSHGKYSIFNPVMMGDDNKDLFKRILNGFLEKYEFQLPEIFKEDKHSETTA
jgi:wobble nucleotide-excising tRNase